ncbi:MAG: ubiquinone-dependent pyruvate dehydrogenase [Sphingobium sp.]|uniref:ubiquinone-dependent pyruvate dehydrogenase n=1 Tax=Sphingobium TaxID=165695 RepID=UPI0002E74E40|nr:MULTISPECIES: ubiquinone-dependent pyruvate dehydrogenase [Sphingobium]MBU0658355.1 ubiquinone-dependent pyruvate dehydrogenase [Alphaproteobacteria bacterium]MBA4754830.1 ubiquinone-dependent pyruvate dehydrogenase [Sphingobium sp.]MBS89583.1 ubiquinone-dependent pyruvate dehydrogenase [Sphingobium sp.]MBU0774702.1 ubiquinone-dependent pyruvate dehydrogenase [Alphaproteobacteria bacterium]MBU0866570.1 ubiquinone-dependent pyruvate dehydrogenase [Alphaproteobacteria bacterium]|tara:strand:+ start:472 stop:2181 length:1710 start_codon:yes stop_codon:yes gene_type:complete
MTTVAQVIIETLQSAGVRRCYGVPGDTLNHITDAIRTSDIRWVHVRHEEAAGFAAGADAMLTGELAACAGSCGPGSLHFINGLFESHRNRAPVILIASQIVRDELGFDFPQEVDFKSVYASCSVFCEEIRTPAQARRMTAMAAQAALAKRGVAVLIVPADVSSAKAPDEPHFAVHRAAPVVLPSDAELDRLASAINAGKRVAIYGGSGCEMAHDAVVALASRLRAPVARTSRAKDFLEADNQFDVGMTGIFGSESGYHALMSCDVLLLLGCDFAWRQFYPDKATILQVDLDGTHLGRRHPVDIGVVGDIGPTLEALLPRITPREDDSFVNECLDHHRKAVAAQAKHATEGKGGAIHPQYLTEMISRHADADAIFTADGGSPMVWCLRHIASTGQNRTVVSLSHGTMANAMPQALGAKAAFPDRQVISLSGDGGIAMLMGDLLTAIQEKLPIKVVVYNNGALDFVEIEQKVEGLLDSYTELVNPDFARVAEAIGFRGWRVEKAQDLESMVQAWLAEPGPALLDVVTDRFELVMPPNVKPGQVAGMALYSAKAVLNGRGRDVVGIVRNLLS